MRIVLKTLTVLFLLITSIVPIALPVHAATYAPITLTNNQTASNGLALDGSASNTGPTTNTLTVTISTTTSPDVIYLTIVQGGTGATVSSITDTAGLTWTLRTSDNAGSPSIWTYYAIANGPLSADVITVTLVGTASNLSLFV